MIRNLILTIVVALTIAGCNITKVHNNIGYNIENARTGPMSTVKPLCIEIGGFIDKRQDTSKIGYSLSPILGSEVFTFLTSSPVDQIIRDSFSAEFQKNGHRVGCTSDVDILVSGKINTFLLEQIIRSITVIVNASVDLDIKVTDVKTGNILLARPYQAVSSSTYYTANNNTSCKNRESVMNSALEEIVRDLSGDQELINKLNAL